jgi:hypothetical protein
MRKIIALTCAILMAASMAHASKFWPATALTGGGVGALDAIDGSGLTAGDAAMVVTTSSVVYFYCLVDDSASESSPTVIRPDTNAGTHSWHMVSVYAAGYYGSAATMLDSDAPGTDKEIAKIVGAYIDGADGSENGTLDLYVHEGGASTSYVQLDGKNTDVEVKKPLVCESTLKLLSSDDPDTSAAGQITHDTDGWLRAYDNSIQKAVRLQEEIHVTVIKPNDLADAQRDAFLVWSNESGMNFVITGWKGWSDTDDTTLNIETTAADGQTNATVDAVELATNGTGVFTGADTTITAATIANGGLIWLDFDDTDTPGYVKMTIYGYYNADVN